MEWLLTTGASYLLKVQVAPGASKTEIVGPYGDRLKIRLNAAPEKGEANRALLAYLAQRLGLAKNQLRLKSGPKDRAKVVEIVSADPLILDKLASLWPPA